MLCFDHIEFYYFCMSEFFFLNQNYLPLFQGEKIFEEKLIQICMSWLEDNVYAIREAAAINLGKLVAIFGKDWGAVNVIPKVITMSREKNYLHRIICLQCFNVSGKLVSHCGNMNINVTLRTIILTNSVQYTIKIEYLNPKII